MDDALIREFLTQFDDSRFPAGFLRDYEAMECLAFHDSTETLLVKERTTGKLCVAKCYSDKSLISRSSEAALLKGLSHPGLPAFIGEYENDDMVCVVREYIEGETLDAFAAHQKGLSPEQCVDILAKLCDILTYLHARTPPVIHRDIKPQNIVIAPDGSIRLIDFGISRVFDETAETDTVCFGTRKFAAPEQYGFSQTDARADIFSAGVLLCFLLTGETEPAAALVKIKNPRLKSIVKRSTAFAPAQRFKSAAHLKAALLRADGRMQKRLLRAAVVLAACILFFCAGFFIGRYTKVSPAIFQSAGVRFYEPLVEQSVRLALNKPENMPITVQELLNATEVFIYGNHAAVDQVQFHDFGDSMMNKDGTVQNGGMRALEDLAKLKNLRSVYIALQDIEYISPLSALPSLETVDIRHNPVADISPLAHAQKLETLCAFGTQVSDFSPLTNCPALRTVDAGGTPVTSMTAFAGLGNLRELYLRKTALSSLAGIQELTHIETMALGSVADDDLTPLLTLASLKQVQLPEELRGAAEQQLKDAPFEISFY